MPFRTRFVENCAAYLMGLVSSAEVLPVVRQQRDKMLTRVAIGALQRSLDALSMRDLGRAMQAVTDAWALGAAMPALDDFTLHRVRRAPEPSLSPWTAGMCQEPLLDPCFLKDAHRTQSAGECTG